MYFVHDEAIHYGEPINLHLAAIYVRTFVRTLRTDGRTDGRTATAGPRASHFIVERICSFSQIPENKMHSKQIMLLCAQTGRPEMRPHFLMFSITFLLI